MAPKPPAGPSIQEQIDAALAKIGTGGGKTGFIGLPGSSTANETGAYMDPSGPPPAAGLKYAPLYHDGAQNAPLMSNWDKVKISRLQARLVQAGLLDTDYRDGWWDKASSDAFTQVLSDANNMGQPDYEVALDGRINSLPMEIDPKTGLPRHKVGAGTSKRAPLSLTLSNSDDLASTANEIAQKRIGRTFSDDELKRFVASYHAAEAGAQRSQYADQGAGGTTEANASPDTAANTFAEQLDPVAAQARNMLPMVQGINDLLNGKGQVETTKPLQGSF